MTTEWRFSLVAVGDGITVEDLVEAVTRRARGSGNDTRAVNALWSIVRIFASAEDVCYAFLSKRTSSEHSDQFNVHQGHAAPRVEVRRMNWRLGVTRLTRPAG